MQDADRKRAARLAEIKELSWEFITDRDRANFVLATLYKAASDGICHVARGRVRINDILPGFTMVVHEVLPTELNIVSMGDTYIYKASFLQQLAATAGLRTTRPQRCDDESDPLVCEYGAALSGMDLAFCQRTWTGTYSLDLRDGSARVEAIPKGKPKMLRAKREHMHQIAATGAFSRAVIEALALQRGFDNRHAALLPVYIPSMQVNARDASEQVRQMLSEGAIRAALGLFGPPPVAPPDHLPQPPPQSGDEPFEACDEVPVEAEDGAQDDVPFDSQPMPPPSKPDDAEPLDRPITAEEIGQLKDAGAYDDELLRRLGWDGTQWPISLSLFRAAMKEKAGGAS